MNPPKNTLQRSGVARCAAMHSTPISPVPAASLAQIEEHTASPAVDMLPTYPSSWPPEWPLDARLSDCSITTTSAVHCLNTIANNREASPPLYTTPFSDEMIKSIDSPQESQILLETISALPTIWDVAQDDAVEDNPSPLTSVHCAGSFSSSLASLETVHLKPYSPAVCPLPEFTTGISMDLTLPMFPINSCDNQHNDTLVTDGITSKDPNQKLSGEADEVGLEVGLLIKEDHLLNEPMAVSALYLPSTPAPENDRQIPVLCLKYIGFSPSSFEELDKLRQEPRQSIFSHSQLGLFPYHSDVQPEVDVIIEEEDTSEIVIASHSEVASELEEHPLANTPGNAFSSGTTISDISELKLGGRTHESIAAPDILLSATVTPDSSIKTPTQAAIKVPESDLLDEPDLPDERVELAVPSNFQELAGQLSDIGIVVYVPHALDGSATTLPQTLEVTLNALPRSEEDSRNVASGHAESPDLYEGTLRAFDITTAEASSQLSTHTPQDVTSVSTSTYTGNYAIKFKRNTIGMHALSASAILLALPSKFAASAAIGTVGPTATASLVAKPFELLETKLKSQNPSNSSIPLRMHTITTIPQPPGTLETSIACLLFAPILLMIALAAIRDDLLLVLEALRPSYFGGIYQLFIFVIFVRSQLCILDNSEL
ncbi:hypothetical protein HWV62_23969 [Athelia sp. TMB]|nr:hypothetical protein HWV62_23969 [Athelia sp. TMB]